MKESTILYAFDALLLCRVMRTVQRIPIKTKELKFSVAIIVTFLLLND